MDPNTHLYTRTPRQLQVVIGMDLAHLGPHVISSYRDEHGFVQVYSCPFSGRLVAAGNRQFPLSRSDVKQIMTKLSTSGFFGCVQEVFGEEEEDQDGVTTLAGMFTSNHELPLLPPAQFRPGPLRQWREQWARGVTQQTVVMTPWWNPT